jgi:hypothetical protein
MRMRPVDVSPQLCESFDFQRYEKMYLQKAPVLFGLIRTLSCVEDSMHILHAGAEAIREELLDEEAAPEMEDEEEGGDGVQNADDAPENMAWDEVGVSNRQKPKRKPRNKALMAVMSFSIMMAARSQRINGITVSATWYSCT